MGTFAPSSGVLSEIKTTYRVNHGSDSAYEPEALS